MKVYKMHGLGNDYIFADCVDSSEVEKTPEYTDMCGQCSKKISDRRTGVGSDGLIVVRKSHKADFSMEIYNSDGSVAEMCGNGIRCVGKLLYDNGYARSDTVSVETLGGIKILSLKTGSDGKCARVRVDMGAPILKASDIPAIWNEDRIIDTQISAGWKKYRITAVSMGNPHAVMFMDDIDKLNVKAVGSLIEHHSMFPARVNAEFAQITDRSHIKMRVWERGAGETSACGTGACATTVAAILTGRCDDAVTVMLPGGELDILWDRKSGHVFMEGSATFVCEIKNYDFETELFKC